MSQVKTYEHTRKQNLNKICCILSFHRPEMDTEWTYIREPIETNSMVLKGLLPETEYQFIVRAVNVHGASPPSHINNPVRTLGKVEQPSCCDVTARKPSFQLPR